MEKRRFAMTREPIDLECFIANFIEEYEENEAKEIEQKQEFCAGNQNPHRAIAAGY